MTSNSPSNLDIASTLSMLADQADNYANGLTDPIEATMCGIVAKEIRGQVKASDEFNDLASDDEDHFPFERKNDGHVCVLEVNQFPSDGGSGVVFHYNNQANQVSMTFGTDHDSFPPTNQNFKEVNPDFFTLHKGRMDV